MSMSDNEWVIIERVSGDLQAEILRGLLEAQGIPVLLSREGAGRAIGLSVGPLGEVVILVTAQSRQEALQVLAKYRDGWFETSEEFSEGDSSTNDEETNSD